MKKLTITLLTFAILIVPTTLKPQEPEMQIEGAAFEFGDIEIPDEETMGAYYSDLINQLLSGAGDQEQITIKLTPSLPRSNQDVAVQVSSVSTNINRSDISWYINGQFVKRGVGLSSLDIRTGNAGSTLRIRVVIGKNDGSVSEKEISIRVSELDIVAEAETYTPPFYKGKSLPSYQSDYRFVAVPNFFDDTGRKIPNSQISYTWRINGDVDQANSGVGRDVYTYRTNILSRPVEVNLLATATNSNQQVRIIRTFNFVEPKILFYENNPLMGYIFERAITGNVELGRREIELGAMPFFFSRNILANTPYTWYLDNKKIDGLQNNFVVFRRTDGNPGNVRISARLQSTDRIMQAAESSFGMFYRQNNSFQF